MRERVLLRFIGPGLVACLAALGVSAAPVLASATHPNPAGQVLDIGTFPGNLPANCPFTNQDASFLFTDGHAVTYGTTNQNGSWGGFNVEGNAIFQEAALQLYEGHVHAWFGNGNNVQGQAEFGLTIEFHGTGVAGSLDLHANAHGTMNANGTVTANVFKVSITCY
jgi:hypothetical protein